MLLHVRSISISIAVACLFIISFIAWCSGLAPLTCCKRAITGAIVVYVLATVAANIINNIMIGAMVKSQLEEQNKELSGPGN